MIVLFTDFGLHGPYLGQVRAVLAQQAPKHPVIDLFADAPVFNISCAAYLLAAYSPGFPPGTVFCAIVDPGVGSDQREPVVVQASGYWFVGPDNGLFAPVVATDPAALCWRVDWQPQQYSATFHGRDIFAPVAAMLANGEPPPGNSYPQARSLNNDWPVDYEAVIYCDHFGNAMTGIRAVILSDDDVVEIGAYQFRYARTYNDVAVGDGFWYRNANGLVEIAINQGNAAQHYGLKPGVAVNIVRR